MIPFEMLKDNKIAYFLINKTPLVNVIASQILSTKKVVNGPIDYETKIPKNSTLLFYKKVVILKQIVFSKCTIKFLDRPNIWSKPPLSLYNTLNNYSTNTLKSVPLYVIVNSSNQVLKFSSEELLPNEKVFFRPTETFSDLTHHEQTFSFLFLSKKDAELYLQNVTRTSNRTIILSKKYGMRISTVSLNTGVQLIDKASCNKHKYFIFPDLKNYDSLVHSTTKRGTNAYQSNPAVMAWKHLQYDSKLIPQFSNIPVYTIKPDNFLAKNTNASTKTPLKLSDYFVFFSIEDVNASWKKYRVKNETLLLEENPTVEVSSLSKLLTKANSNNQNLIFIPSSDYYKNILKYTNTDISYSLKIKTFFNNQIQPKIFFLWNFNFANTNQIIDIDDQLVNRKDFLWDKTFPSKKMWKNYKGPTVL